MRLTFVFLICSFYCFAQDELIINLEPELDLYERFMELEQPSTSQIDSMIQLGVAYSYTNKDSCLNLGLRSVELAKNADAPFIYAKALVELGDSYRIFRDLSKAEKLLLEGRTIFESIGNEAQLANVNNILGALTKNKGDNEGAIKYYLKALETWENLKDTQNIIKPYINIGAVFQSTGRVQKAIEYNNKALEFAEVLDDDRARNYIANNMGILYNDLALKYQAMADSSKTKRPIFLDSVDFFVAKAIDKYNLSLEIAKNKRDLNATSRNLGNLARLYKDIGEYTKAIELIEEAENIKNSQSTRSGINIMIIKANVFRDMGQTQRAISIAEEAKRLSSEQGLGKELASAEEQLFYAYKALGNFSKALLNFESFKSYTDENGAKERIKAIADVETRYQTVKKEKLILEQKTDILELEQEKARALTQRNNFIGGGLIFTILGFFGFQLYRVRKERNDKKAFAEALIFAQEEERKRIARDLHDGVGQSLLLIKKQLDKTHGVSLENQALIGETLEEVRSISRELHPFQIKQQGISSAIKNLIDKISASSELFISKEIDDIDDLIDEKTQINLYRTIQEALSNILKHAEATAAKIEVKKESKHISIQVQDNGKGFDHELQVVKSKSLGLRTMFERVSSMGSKLKIDSVSSKGTAIHFRIPIGNN